MQITTESSATQVAEPQRAALGGGIVLVVEDEALLAHDIVSTIEENGGHAMGPIHRLDVAMAQRHLDRLDCALLDVDIAGMEVFAFADRLEAAGVPIVFHTARPDTSQLAARYPRAGIICKPCLARGLVEALSAALFASETRRTAPGGAAARLSGR